VRPKRRNTICYGYWKVNIVQIRQETGSLSMMSTFFPWNILSFDTVCCHILEREEAKTRWWTTFHPFNRFSLLVHQWIQLDKWKPEGSPTFCEPLLGEQSGNFQKFSPLNNLYVSNSIRDQRFQQDLIPCGSRLSFWTCSQWRSSEVLLKVVLFCWWIMKL
jgi:hypothetical protein